MNSIVLTIVSDISCPFCWIGHKHVEMALSSLPAGLNATVVLSPWFLDEHAVTGTGGRGTYHRDWKNDKQRHYSEKFRMTDGRDYPVFEQTAAWGAKIGLHYAMPVGGTVGSTIRAHRLLRHAASQGKGKQVELAMELFRAYYHQTAESSWDITSVDALQRCAEAVGLEPAATRAFLATDDGEGAVRAAAAANAAAGVTGVPQITVAARGATAGRGGASAEGSARRVLQGAVSPEAIRAAILALAGAKDEL